MEKYKIRIEEILSYEFEVTANSKEEADMIATRMYQEGEVVLDWENHEDTNISVF